MTTPSVTEPVSSTAETPTYESLLAAVTDADGREILDPATGEVVGRVAERSVDDLDRAIAPSAPRSPAWAARADAERSRPACNRAADAVEAAAEALAELLSREQGKPLNGPERPLRGRRLRRLAARDRGAPSCPAGDRRGRRRDPRRAALPAASASSARSARGTGR